MMVIGLTGGIASGKSTVAAMLRKANIPVIDADELAREVTKKGSPTLAELARVFGAKIVAQDETLDRQALANIVFDDPGLLKKLESIVHPQIKLLAKQRLQDLADAQHAVAVYMAPLIFETDLHKELAKTLVVITRRELAIERGKKRDGATDRDIEKRLNAQLDDQRKMAMADAVIDNNGSLHDLEENLENAWKKLTGMDLQLKNEE